MDDTQFVLGVTTSLTIDVSENKALLLASTATGLFPL